MKRANDVPRIACIAMAFSCDEISYMSLPPGADYATSLKGQDSMYCVLPVHHGACAHRCGGPLAHAACGAHACAQVLRPW